MDYKLGGLGANIGGDDWERAKKKQEIMNHYGNLASHQNTTSTGMYIPPSIQIAPSSPYPQSEKRKNSITSRISGISSTPINPVSEPIRPI